jgi:hypothetical protein
MTTTTLDKSDQIGRTHDSVRTRVRVGRIGVGSIAVLTILISIWAAAVPYMGPLFGYDATGTGSWHWSLSHSLLGLVPGALAAAVGLLVLAQVRGITLGSGRLSLSVAGFILLLCGAWIVVGPTVWPAILSTSGTYFVAASPLRSFVNQLGYSLGAGVMVAACGGFIAGWAARHGAAEAPSEARVDMSPNT